MAVFEQTENRRYPLRAVAQRTLAVWLAALALLGAGFWLIDRGQGAHLGRMIGAEEQALVERAASILAAELSQPLADLPYLAERPAVRGRLETGGDPETDRIGPDFLTLARHRANYARICLFDGLGFELVQVNRDAAGARLAPREAEQDQATRHFVRDGLAVPAGEIHVSGLDLNAERGGTEGPPRTKLRFSTTIANPGRGPLGLVVVDYPVRHLLNRLATLAPDARGPGLWLRDAAGNWLAAGEPRDAWTFDRDGGEPRFADRLAKHWAGVDAVNPGKTGQATIGEDLFTWRQVAPVAPTAGWALSGPGAGGWILVSRVPRRTLAAAGAAMRQTLWGWLLGAAALALGGTAVLAHHQVRHRDRLQRVEASEARFQKLLESAPDAVLIVDDEGRIRLANARVTDWFGYPPQELLGRPVETLIPQPLHECHRRHRGAYMAAPHRNAMGAGMPLTARRSDGSEFPVEISLSPLATAGDTLVIAVVRDVTERQRLERAREEAQMRFRRLLDNLPLGVFRSSMSERLSDDRRFLEVNPALVDMFEAASAERLLACPPAHLYHDDAERAALVAELFALGSVVGRELGMVTLNGRVFDARLSAVMRRDAAGNRFVDGVIEDISARRAAERERDRATRELQRRAAALEAANCELDAFSHSASHDLQVPLRAIDGFSRILEQEYGDCLDDRGRDYLDGLRDAAERMAAQIHALSQLSRITRAELTPQAVDLSALAATLLACLQRRDPERVARCVIEPGIRALGDACLLRVALDNLLENAWKFTARRAEAAIEFGMREEAGEKIFYLRDNGMGFDMAAANGLFGAFQRLQGARDFPGTGIGLTVVQRVIQKHGGRVWAEAEVDRGATFYFTLGTALSGYEGAA